MGAPYRAHLTLVASDGRVAQDGTSEPVVCQIPRVSDRQLTTSPMPDVVIAVFSPPRGYAFALVDGSHRR